MAQTNEEIEYGVISTKELAVKMKVSYDTMRKMVKKILGKRKFTGKLRPSEHKKVIENM